MILAFIIVNYLETLYEDILRELLQSRFSFSILFPSLSKETALLEGGIDVCVLRFKLKLCLLILRVSSVAVLLGLFLWWLEIMLLRFLALLRIKHYVLVVLLYLRL